jgi:hypothetical protein
VGHADQTGGVGVGFSRPESRNPIFINAKQPSCEEAPRSVRISGRGARGIRAVTVTWMVGRVRKSLRESACMCPPDRVPAARRVH